MKAWIALPALLLAGFAEPMGTQAVLDASAPSEWRPLNPETTLYMELASGTVVMELAPEFAPNTVANIKTLVRQGFFDGVSINRVQENYVVQWGDPDGEDTDPAKRRTLGKAAATIATEFERSDAGLAFDAIPGPDGFADSVGFSNGFAVAKRGKMARLTHCYATLGVGRGDAPDSGSGAELYVVIGHAPRHLDRNVAIVGRVLAGMEHFGGLPRGTGALGFYENPEQRVPIKRIRVGSDMPAAERLDVEIMRTDSASFGKFVDARAHRSRDGWFIADTGFIDLCNIRVPQRPVSRP